jgi:hypothetical protein
MHYIFSSIFCKDHFRKAGQSKVDVEKAKRVVKRNSAKNCASICLNDTVYSTASQDYKCVSFDVCQVSADVKDGVYCSFYNYSTSTDPDVVLETAPECDHYTSMKSFFFY